MNYNSIIILKLTNFYVVGSSERHEKLTKKLKKKKQKIRGQRHKKKKKYKRK